MDMEMSSGGGVAGAVTPKLQEEDPAAVAEQWSLARRRRVLLVAGVMAMLLLAFFVLGQESASTVWEIASAKFIAMNNGGRGFMDASHHGHGAAGNATADELLGRLLAPGMDLRSCRSRYELWRYFKHFPYAPSPHLLRTLRAYEARHRRCAPGTPLYAEAVEQLRSGRGGSATAECRYVVWLPFDGLGNRMLSMESGFLHALLTGRVFLVALPPDSADLFCEPFPGTTWLLPHQDFPVANLFGLGVSPEASYTSLLNNKKIAAVVVDDDDTADSNATSWPAYVYLSLGWQLTDRLFFCGEHQRAIGKVSWLLLYSDLYFAPSLYAVTGEFRDELRRLFPEKEAASHLLLRYLFHPSNAVWGLVTRYYHSYLAPATTRIGVQIRMFGFGSIPVDDMYNQILACSRQERILPETDDGDGDGDGDAAAAADTDTGNKTTAIMIASLYADYYERLRARYYEHAAASDKGGGVWVGVFQPTHEERQATENLAHNQMALAEVYLLSFSEELLTSGMSTFGYVSSSLAGVRPTILLTAHGHKVPKPPCRRAVSMEPCNLTPPRGDECRAAKHGKDSDLKRHVRACEDAGGGVKFFD